MTRRLAGWRRTIQRRGGFWRGSASYNLEEGSLYEMKDLFINGLGRRFTEEIGGDVTWEGFLGQVDMTLEGQVWTRSLLDCANSVRVFYTRTSENLFDNPYLTDDAWPEEGTPNVCERSTDWSIIGDYSMHVRTSVLSNDDGVQVGMTAPDAAITIESEMAYQVKVSVNIESGTWVLKVKRTSDDNTIAKCKSAGTGEQILCADITEDNTETSVRVILIEKDIAASGELYVDNAIFQYAPVKAETGRYRDTTSISTYGRIEDIIMEEILTDTQAIGRANWHLAHRAWPRTLPSRQITIAPGRAV